MRLDIENAEQRQATDDLMKELRRREAMDAAAKLEREKNRAARATQSSTEPVKPESDARLRSLFGPGSDAKLANKLAIENIDEYRRLKAVALNRWGKL